MNTQHPENQAPATTPGDDSQFQADLEDALHEACYGRGHGGG